MTCEVCDTGFYIEKYGDGVCPSCGTEYRYDEGTNIYLSAEQCQLLKTGRQEIETLQAELARLRETVAELESERDYWRELAGWAESDSFVTRPRPTRFQ